MPGIARQFEPQITRIGGVPSKYRFTVRCSECQKTDTYEASTSPDDGSVRSYFKDRGWLLARDRAHDLCSACLTKPHEAQRPRQRNDARRHRSPDPAPPPDRPAPADKRSQDISDILARHLGKPEALAEEIFRPKPVPANRPSAGDAPRQDTPVSALSPEVEQALTGIAAELKDLRSTMDLMTEQMSKLVALGTQQIEAIARLAPVVAQSAEGISGNLREVVSAIQLMPNGSIRAGEAPKPASKAMSLDERPALQLNLQELEPAADLEAESAPIAMETKTPSKKSRRSRGNVGNASKTGSALIVVKSIPDAKRSDRFYTAIRLPRALWDQAGFGPHDRLLLDWSGKALTIERATEGGVKPKAIGGTSVVLQSWKLGNLNFDHMTVTETDAGLRLTKGRRPT